MEQTINVNELLDFLNLRKSDKKLTLHEATDQYIKDNQFKVSGETLEYEKEEYIYVQQIINDELVDKYMIYKYNKEQNAMMPITEKTKTEILLKLFVESITKDLGEE